MRSHCLTCLICEAAVEWQKLDANPVPSLGTFVLDKIQEAAGGSDRVVLQWGDDGQVTLQALEVACKCRACIIDVEPMFRLVAAGAAPLEPQP